MEKMKQFIKMDLWIVLLDIMAVNASYYLALLVRFYVNSQFRPTVGYYHDYFLRIAPFYTVAAIAIFFLCRLYKGMWTAAGLNDMNRIIVANLLTVIAQVIISLIVGIGIPQASRMPFSYYTIGALTQFVFTAGVRFASRVIRMEKAKIARDKMETIPALVVGSGEMGHKVVHYLEENTPYRAVAIAGENSGRSMDGIPVIGLEQIAEQIKSKQIKIAFIADKELSKAQREAINEVVEGIEVQDFTGQLSNLSGFVPLSALMEIIDSPLTVVVDGKEKQYANGRECLQQLEGEYTVLSVEAKKISIRKKNDNSWMLAGTSLESQDVSFF